MVPYEEDSGLRRRAERAVVLCCCTVGSSGGGAERPSGRGGGGCLPRCRHRGGGPQSEDVWAPRMSRETSTKAKHGTTPAATKAASSSST
jgi:hypothetical protein